MVPEKILEDFLRKRRELSGFATWRALAEAADVGEATVYRILREGVDDPNSNLNSRNAFAKAMRFTDWWELVRAYNRGDLVMNLDDPFLSGLNNVRLTEPATEIPLYESVSAVRKDMRDAMRTGTLHAPHDPKSSERFFVVLDGDCMEPNYRDGDRVLCDIGRWKQERLVDGAAYWLQLEGDEFTFKRVRFDPASDRHIFLEPDNRKYKSLRVDRSQIVLAARAVEVISKAK